MNIVFRQNQLFTFLLYCNNTGLDKIVLDCGAGGNCPPLAIFAQHGYKTFGIEISDRQIELAQEFERENGLELGIVKGDMRRLPFDDNSISYVYSYNSIFHMRKKEIAEALREIRRVMPKGGLAFINFASHYDQFFGEGQKLAEGEFLQQESGEQVVHSYFNENEAEGYFGGFKIIYKENRIRERYDRQNEKIRMGYIDYILEKI